MVGRAQGVSRRGIHTALSCRMDSFEDTLRQLREAFNTGRTRTAEFRAEQLRGLSRFLRDHKQQLQEALAQDLHKVPGGQGHQGGSVCGPGSARVAQLGQGTQLSYIFKEEVLEGRGNPVPFVSTADSPSPPHNYCAAIYRTLGMCLVLVPGLALGTHREHSKVPASTELTSAGEDKVTI